MDKIGDLKGQDIVATDVHGKFSTTGCMIICTGTSTRHVMSIADRVVQKSHIVGTLPLDVEGKAVVDWIVADSGNVMIHIMQEKSRCPYEPEKLWS